MRRFATPAVILLLILIGVGGFFLGRQGWVGLKTGNSINKAQPDKTGQIRDIKSGGEKVVLFFLRSTPTDFYLKPVLWRVKNNGDKHLEALKALFAGPSPGSNLQPLFPKGTKVLGLNIKDGVAYLNLNSEATRLNVGASGEALAVASIVNTLTKFPDVFRVKILVEGKEVESLAGHFDLTGLLRYDEQVIDPDLF
ncbi:MAG: GerMN domain-containing protein [Bacillota bacterium]